jgi:serine/threonine-protein phosphatase 6 regulatory ankyrin repeat subunit A/serine/threonine-protein phosphatase 6 regulatory ankyrin repeat subunit B
VSKHFISQAAEGDSETLRLFLKAGMDPNTKNRSGHTALMAASAGGQTEIAALLFDSGAAIEPKSKIGKTALMFAAENKNRAMLRFLLDYGADVNAKDEYEKEEDLEAVRLLLEAEADVKCGLYQGTHFLLGS